MSIAPIDDGEQLSSVRAKLNLTIDEANKVEAVEILAQSALQPEDINVTVAGTIDDIYSIADGASVDIDPANGGIQLWILGANRTPTAANFVNGQSVTLLIDDGTAYAITWTIVDKWFGGAPTLSTTELTGIVLFKAGGVVYGAALSEIAA